MKNRKLMWSIPFVIILFIASGNVNATSASIPATNLVTQQVNQVTGKVSDINGDPLFGVSVIEKGVPGNGAITDMDGGFSIKVSPNSTLIISYIGFRTVETSVQGRQNIAITLHEDSEMLDEIVVIGYGAVRKADLAGSVAVLDNKSFKDQPIIRVSDALQGRVSGVSVENSGIPGGGVKVRIRGAGSITHSNDPLYVVDGMVRESGMDGLNPEDIASMQILKDASATAIYGSRGSNGVVLITSKTGKAGTTQVMFDASIGLSNVYKKYDVLNTLEYAQALKEYGRAELTDYLNGTKNGIDWQDEIFRTGLIQNYKIAFSGGNDKTQYYISGNYAGQTGVTIATKNERYQAKVNVSSQVTDWLKVTADINASRNVQKSGDFGTTKDNPIWIALNYSPTMTMMGEDGKYNRDIYNNVSSNNPVGILKENGFESMSSIFTGRVDFKFNIVKGLTFTTTNGVDYFDSKVYGLGSKKVNAQNNMYNNDTYRMLLQSSNNFTYVGKWNEHGLTATAVWEASKSETRRMGITGTDLQTESVSWWDIKMAKNRDAFNNYQNWALLSGVGRIMYNYADRYLLTGTIRADGSSRFSKDKWGFFPSVAAAWTVSNENFMKNVNVVQGLKLRASFGIVGNQDIAPYSTLGLMSSTSFNMGTTTDYTGYWAGDIATPDLTWEKTRQFDVGLEFSLFKHRLNFSVDYFDKRTTDALLQKELPKYMGGTKFWSNEGEISNKGVDISINAHAIESKDFSWSTTLTGTYLKNRVEKLTSGVDYIEGSNPAFGMVSGGATIIKPGHPIGSFYGYVWTGLDENGLDTYKGMKDDGTIDGSSREIIGKATPDFTFGWNNTMSYKNWDLNLFFNASFGAQRLNLLRYTMSTPVSDATFITLREAYEKNFDKIGMGAIYPSVNAQGNLNQPVSTKWLEDADYFRLENVSLSYNLSKKVAKFADIRFTLSCQNLFTITSYKGMDPAGSNFSGDNVDIDAGIDMGAYPLPRTFTLGVRMNF